MPPPPSKAKLKGLTISSADAAHTPTTRFQCASRAARTAASAASCAADSASCSRRSPSSCRASPDSRASRCRRRSSSIWWSAPPGIARGAGGASGPSMAPAPALGRGGAVDMPAAPRGVGASCCSCCCCCGCGKVWRQAACAAPLLPLPLPSVANTPIMGVVVADALSPLQRGRQAAAWPWDLLPWSWPLPVGKWSSVVTPGAARPPAIATTEPAAPPLLLPRTAQARDSHRWSCKARCRWLY
jgi:hypothetical protein